MILYITLSSPGFLIGKKGKNLIRLTEYLKSSIEFKDIKIKEDGILAHLYDFDIRGIKDDF